MTKGNTRQRVTVRIDADTDRLYGDMDTAIAYLKEMRGKYGHHEHFTLDEHWTGYEDMEMTFSYVRDETDAEMSERLEAEDRRRKAYEYKKKMDDARAKDIAEYRRLKSSLGY